MTTNGCSKKLCPMQVGTVDNCTLTKEQCPYFTQDIDYNKVINQIKAEVAREIFEEIEKIMETLSYDYKKVSRYQDGDTVWYVKDFLLAELKKKYTEENK